MIQHFRYVLYSDLPAYLAKGWINIGPTPGHHGAYSCICLWPFEGEPPE
jgi:hypothetical protein